MQLSRLNLLWSTLLVTACGSANFGSSTGVGSKAKAPAPAPASGDAQQNAAPGAAPASDGTAPAAAPGAQPSASTDSSGIGSLIKSIGDLTKAGLPALPAGKKSCSSDYSVPGTASPYFAGTQDGSLTYDLTLGGGPNPVDTVKMDAPVLVTPVDTACIAVGAKLSFAVHGAISVGGNDTAKDANGNLAWIVNHQLGATNGKSDITAPINSLIGVFLGPNDPAGAPAPAALSFATQAQRDYVALTPTVGQVFFIGTGKTTDGQYHVVTVPAGATRLYFAVMDRYQWNNNQGSLNGSIFVN